MLFGNHSIFTFISLLFGIPQFKLSQTKSISQHFKCILILDHTLVVDLLCDDLRPTFGVSLFGLFDFRPDFSLYFLLLI